MKVNIWMGILLFLTAIGVVLAINTNFARADLSKPAICDGSRECQCKNTGITSCGMNSACRQGGSGCRCGK